jgi:hypothetical protein
MREEVKLLWNRLDTSPSNAIIFVQGYPGVGKSIVVFAHTMQYCRSNNKTLLYYHSCVAQSKCFIMDHHGIVQFVSGDQVQFVISNRHNYDVTVIDGTHSEDELRKMFLNFPNNKKLIFCTYYQPLKLNQEAYFRICKRLIRCIVASWTTEDYIKGVEANCFPFLNGIDEQSRVDAIHSRFRICGGSVRLFAGSLDQARSYIQYALRTVSNYKDLYE